MLNELAMYVILGLAGVCMVIFFAARHFYKKYKTSSTEHAYLQSMYTALEIHYKALQATAQAKKEVQDEKDKQLTEIASGSADDVIIRLQNRNNKRSDKNSSS